MFIFIASLCLAVIVAVKGEKCIRGWCFKHVYPMLLDGSYDLEGNYYPAEWYDNGGYSYIAEIDKCKGDQDRKDDEGCGICCEQHLSKKKMKGLFLRGHVFQYHFRSICQCQAMLHNSTSSS